MVATVFTQMLPFSLPTELMILKLLVNPPLISVLEQSAREFLRVQQWQAACEVVVAQR
jgi:hypothetical protein